MRGSISRSKLIGLRICALLASLLGGLPPAPGRAAEPLVHSATAPLPPIQRVAIGQNREFLVNGKAFLPIMSWAQAPRNFKMLRVLGINTFCGNSGRISAKEQSEMARLAGGYAVAGFDRPDAVGDPNLLAWIHGDEPDMPQQGGAGGVRPKRAVEEVMATYREIKQADASRPVFITFTSYFMNQIRGEKYDAAAYQKLYPQYVEACDVAGFDVYPIYGSGHASRLNWPGYGTAQLGELAGPQRPVYAWIETSKGSRWMTYEKQPDVLPKHTRFEVWGVIINGATAIGYFTHRWRPDFKEFAPTGEMQAELKRLNTQVTKLCAPILAPRCGRKITMAMAGGLPCQVKATEYDGALYLFAQNQDLGPDGENRKQFQPISPRSAEATFQVEGLKPGILIEVVDEDRTVRAEPGTFSDTFGELAEHIYRIRI